MINMEWTNDLPADDPTVPTKSEIAQALRERPGFWAVVARHDRFARAMAQTDRIVAGTEYGPEFEAVVRRVGNEHRVYARKIWHGATFHAYAKVK